MEMPKDCKLSLETMGRCFRITAIFTTDAEANAYMEATPNASVIACAAPFIFIADKTDEGVRA